MSSPSVIILSPLGQHFVSQAAVTIGPWTLGTCADLFLQGILLAQTTTYFTSYEGFSASSDTRRRLSWLVIGLTILCLLKSLQNIVDVWEIAIANYCNPENSLFLVIGEWKHYTASLSTAIIATVVQSFFVWRYWKLTRRWYICIVMIVGMLLSIIAACLVVVSLAIPNYGLGTNPGNGGFNFSPPKGPMSPQRWSVVHFGSAIVVDGLITVETAWHLHIQKTNATRSTSEMISRLIWMIWQSALPPTICVVANATVLQFFSLQDTHIAINMVLGKLYAISLIYTLNVGKEMRLERGNSNGISIDPHSYPPASLIIRAPPAGLDESFIPLK
ncbi:hypothetical protein CPB86DRAFT_789625 [Serendipita vermifera]|nr:hypothetical protein CPB86DRAFT_789625 [Serendipita vermifera]